MKYRSVIVPRCGGPDVLEVVENDLRLPRKAEARIRVLAASVNTTDVGARYVHSPLTGLKLYGPASPGKHAILREYGATSIDRYYSCSKSFIQGGSSRATSA